MAAPGHASRELPAVATGRPSSSGGGGRSWEEEQQLLGRANSGLPPTPTRCQLSEELVALTGPLFLGVPGKHDATVGLPFGAILSPAPPRGQELPSVVGPPPACTRCGALLSCYCAASASRGEWHCAFCRQLNDPGDVGSGSGAFSAGSQAALWSEAVDWVHHPSSANGAEASDSSSSSSSRSPARAKLLVVDVGAEEGQLEAAKAALVQALYGIPGSTHVALLACGAAVTAYRLGGAADSPSAAAAAGAHVVHADALPGGSYAETAHLAAALQVGVHLVPLGDCRPQLQLALQSLRSRAAALGRGRPRALGAAVEAALQLTQQLRQGSGAGKAGAAVLPGQQQMQRGRQEVQGHVVVAAGAQADGYALLPTAAGITSAAGADREEEGVAGAEAAADYFAQLAHTAALLGVTIDVVAVGGGGRGGGSGRLAAAAGGRAAHGACDACIAQLAPLAQGSGGQLLLHRSPSSAFTANLSAAAQQQGGLCCHLTVRASSGLAVWQADGALLPLAEAGQASEHWGLMKGEAPLPVEWQRADTWHYRCPAPSPEGGALLQLECTSPSLAQAQHAYLQVAYSWTDEQGQVVDRVVTRRLRVTNNPSAVVEALHPETAGLVWAKAAVAQALEQEASTSRKAAEILKRRLATQLGEFARVYGTPDAGSRSWFSGPSRHQLPAAFGPLVECLYHLQRGPRLSHAAAPWSPQERALLQAQLMTAPLSTARRLCLPEVRLVQQSSSSDGVQFAPAPAMDVALAAGPAVVDAGSCVYVWQGGGAGRSTSSGSEAALQACAEEAAAICGERHPQPDLLLVRHPSSSSSSSIAQGDDVAELLSWLAPLAAAGFRQQAEAVPQLTELAAEEYERAAAFLSSRQEPSYLQWLSSAGILLCRL